MTWPAVQCISTQRTREPVSQTNAQTQSDPHTAQQRIQQRALPTPRRPTHKRQLAPREHHIQRLQRKPRRRLSRPISIPRRNIPLKPRILEPNPLLAPRTRARLPVRLERRRPVWHFCLREERLKALHAHVCVQEREHLVRERRHGTLELAEERERCERRCDC